MIRSLQHLYKRISAKLLHSRIERQQGQEPSAPRREIPIADRLGAHIDQTAKASLESPGSEAESKPPTLTQFGSPRPPASAVDSATRVRSGAGLFGALSKHFSRRRHASHSQSLIQAKMRANTLEHINKALVLAKKGDAEGAKVHAGLATSAMRTAGEFMSEEEYQGFRQEVEERLGAVNRIRPLAAS